ncbi:MAG TPA: hypothetical protein VH680_09445 [Gemmatimonadales bacterium]|jgi:hypothetical protein
MRIHLGLAAAAIVTLASLTGCGSYSAPNNSDNNPTSPDSTGDTTPDSPPSPYLQSIAA